MSVWFISAGSPFQVSLRLYGTPCRARHSCRPTPESIQLATDPARSNHDWGPTSSADQDLFDAAPCSDNSKHKKQRNDMVSLVVLYHLIRQEGLPNRRGRRRAKHYKIPRCSLLNPGSSPWR